MRVTIQPNPNYFDINIGGSKIGYLRYVTGGWEVRIKAPTGSELLIAKHVVTLDAAVNHAIEHWHRHFPAIQLENAGAIQARTFCYRGLMAKRIEHKQYYLEQIARILGMQWERGKQDWEEGASP